MSGGGGSSSDGGGGGNRHPHGGVRSQYTSPKSSPTTTTHTSDKHPHGGVRSQYTTPTTTTHTSDKHPHANEFADVVVVRSPYETGDVYEEDEYLPPDKHHWKATQKAIKKHKKGDHYKADWSDLTKEEQDAYQDEMNKLKGTEGKRYSFYKGNEGTTNLTFGEHWKDAVVKHPALKFSPTARFLYTAGQTLKENLTTDYGTWKYGANPTVGSGAPVDRGGWIGRAKGLLEGTGAANIGTQGTGGDERAAMNIIAPHASYLVGGTTPQASQAAKWYASLGKTSNNTLSFQSQYNAAKTKQASIIGQPSPIRWLAVSQSPFFDFLKENKLDKGIL